ncbi:MAG TPA: hypothetical protein VI387_09660, partial [Candidatus Brocadiales bacterium]|nr:hypothetical protein [Candidatus Brocadiales bacterium]
MSSEDHIEYNILVVLLSRMYSNLYARKDKINLQKVPLRQYGALLTHYLRPQWFRVMLLSIFMFGGIGLNLLN